MIAWRLRFGTMVAALLAGASLAVIAPVAAWAQIGSDRYSAIVIDAESGRVLTAMNPDDPRYPASLTKLMTLFMLFEALRDHRVALDDMVPVSEHAASMEPSKLGLLPGTRLTVEQAIFGLVTKSANDAAAALGEMLGGDETRFAQMMTLRAHALGMTHTVFRNASGLPDPDQITTARDLSVLARHLIQDFPADYHYFSTPSFYFRGHTIYNHDRMLKEYPGADGMKTGYTEAAGHNLVTSALQSNVRLVAVVLGAGSNWERDRDMIAQLDDGFERMDVPVTPHIATASRLPSLIARSLIGSAQAASLPAALRPHVATQHAMAAHPAALHVATAHAVTPVVLRHPAHGAKAKPVALPVAKISASNRHMRNIIAICHAPARGKSATGCALRANLPQTARS